MNVFDIEVAGAKFKMLADSREHFDQFKNNEIDIRSKWFNVSPGDVVVDAGAERGLYALQACAMGAFVYAFEPEMTNYYNLCLNLAVNDFMKSCIALPLGLWKESGVADLWKLGNTSSSFKVAYNDKPNPMGSFLTTTLDSVLIGRVERLDFIKVDVEGAELEMLQGAKKSLEKFSPAVLVENHTAWFPDVEDKVRDFMNSIGYKDTILFKEKGVGTNNIYEKQIR